MGLAVLRLGAADADRGCGICVFVVAQQAQQTVVMAWATAAECELNAWIGEPLCNRWKPLSIGYAVRVGQCDDVACDSKDPAIPVRIFADSSVELVSTTMIENRIVARWAGVVRISTNPGGGRPRSWLGGPLLEPWGAQQEAEYPRAGYLDQECLDQECLARRLSDGNGLSQ